MPDYQSYQCCYHTVLVPPKLRTKAEMQLSTWALVIINGQTDVHIRNTISLLLLNKVK